METTGLYKRVFTAQGSDTTAILETKDYALAVVSITGNSTPDGTVNVYSLPSGVEYTTYSSPACITYATPTTTKQFVGYPMGALLFELTGNSTGDVDVFVVLK